MEVSLYYVTDANGEPVGTSDSARWGLWFADFDNRRVAEDFVGEIQVSTVFLGVDHSFGQLDGAGPVLWETMVFGGRHDGYQERYQSRAAALAGHAAALAMVRASGEDGQ